MQAIITAARQLGVARHELIRDDAAKDKVQAFVAMLRLTSTPPDSARKDVEQAYKKYLATFARAAAVSAPSTATLSLPKRSLRGRSFLLTYNWDFFGRAMPDGTPAFTTEQDLWDNWTAHKQGPSQALQVVQDTDTLERSLLSALEGRVHVHWKINTKDAIDHRTTDAVQFHGIRPDVRSTFVNTPFKGKARGEAEMHREK